MVVHGQGNRHVADHAVERWQRVQRAAVAHGHADSAPAASKQSGRQAGRQAGGQAGGEHGSAGGHDRAAVPEARARVCVRVRVCACVCVCACVREKEKVPPRTVTVVLAGEQV